MDYAEALKAISGIENGEDIINAIKSEVQKKGSGEASLRQKLKAYDGIDPQKTKSVFDTLANFDIDLSDDIETQLSAIREKAGSVDSATSEVKKLQRQVEKLQKQWQEAETEKQKVTAEKARADIFNSLHKDFIDRISNPDVTLNYRIKEGDFFMDETGQMAYKRGDEIITDGIIDAYIADHPNELTVKQKNGSGSNPNAGHNGRIDVGSANPYDLAKMSSADIQAAYEANA